MDKAAQYCYNQPLMGENPHKLSLSHLSILEKIQWQ